MKVLKLKPSIKNHPSRTKKSSLTELRGMMDAVNFFNGYCPLLSSAVNTELFKQAENLFFNFDPYTYTCSNHTKNNTNEIFPSVYAIIMDHLGPNIINVNKDQKQEEQRNEILIQQLTHEALRIHNTICSKLADSALTDSTLTDSTLTDSTSSTDDKLKHIGNQLLLWNIKNTNEQDIEYELKSNDYCDMEEEYKQKEMELLRDKIEEKFKSQLATLQSQLNEAHAETEEERKRNHELQTNMNGIQNENTQLLSELEYLRKQLAEKQKNHLNFVNGLRASLSHININNIDIKKEELSMELIRSKAQIEQSQKIIDRYKSKCEKYEIKIEELNEKLKSGFNDLKNKIDTKNDEIKLLKEKNNKLIEELATKKDISSEIKDKNDEIDDLMNKIELLQTKLSGHEQKFKNKCNEYDELLNKFNKLQKSMDINNIDSGNESDSESLSELATDINININQNDSDNSDEKSNDILHFVPIANDNNIKIKLKERLCEVDVGDQMLDVFAVKLIVNEELHEDIDALFENLNQGKDTFDSVGIDTIVNEMIASHDLKEKLIVTLNINLQLNDESDDEILMDDIKTIDDMEVLHINVNDMKVNEPPLVPSYRYKRAGLQKL